MYKVSHTKSHLVQPATEKVLNPCNTKSLCPQKDRDQTLKRWACVICVATEAITQTGPISS